VPDAASDLVGLARLWSRTGQAPAGQAGELALRPSRPGLAGDFRLRRVGRERLDLSTLLPVLESFGLVVLEAVPWHFRATGEGEDAHVDDIAVSMAPLAGARTLGPFDSERDGPRLVEAMGAVLDGRAEVSVLNRLVASSALGWREVNLLSAYSCLWALLEGPAGGQRAAGAQLVEAMGQALVGFPEVAAAVVSLFTARLAPEAPVGEDDARRALQDALGGVGDLASYGPLAQLAALVESTVRSNWASGAPVVTLKTTRYLPLLSTFVWAPWFAGVHLRYGPVARGGVRWCDEWAEMGNEVAQLASAQVKKNSIIVPTGAKGGFALFKGQGSHHEGKQAYRAFVNGLLDVTDNMVGGRVAHPPGLRCRDGEDAYLVVAPDKGTAHFSDEANDISISRGFWLGDAFASGGSRGYDHKALGITARGAWAAARRHFRALGIDLGAEAVTVAGVGDMSGDVFGNGMLQSDRIRLVAAFDHRHIFVDPDPRPEEAFAERLRLSRLEGSSWADYDLAHASPGAGVFSRHDARLELSPQARALLKLGKGPLSPPEVVRAVLAAPVDLLYFGGVGTFVKGAGEADADIGDRANDDVRVGADALRARVVVEGANLAMTQAARASYARRGGRVNADFVDNAAGVALSDREVNIKILLGLAVAAGRLGADQRDEALATAQGQAVAAVLAQCDEGVVALERAAEASVRELAAYEALLEDLAAPWKGAGHQLAPSSPGPAPAAHPGRGRLDREAEALPGAAELARRGIAGAGLSRPELAVLVAYARSELARDIEASPLATDPATQPLALRYFPSCLLERFADLVPAHPLYRQLVASELANEVVARMGGAWAHEVATGTGRALWEVAAAYWAARGVLGAGATLEDLDRTGASLPSEAEMALRDVAGRAIGGLARYYLARGGPLAVGEVVAQDAASARFLADKGGDAGLVADLEAKGAPNGLAAQVARLLAASPAGPLADVGRLAGCDLGLAHDAWLSMAGALHLGALQEALPPSPRAGRWERAERHLLLDDLTRLRVEAAAGALLAHPGRPGGQAVSEWAHARAGPLKRAERVVGELQAQLGAGAAQASPGGGPTGEERARQLALASLAVRSLTLALQAVAAEH